MGKHEGWAQPSPSGLLVPNGLLPSEAASVVQVLDSERWLKAEERTAELIACIQPNPPSEERRNAVANYVQRLIMKCFPCQVFTFGSVPLKTYLPDGDIDLTAFSKNQNLKDTWAHQVRDILESEEKNEKAEFRVKEVQYIQAEVKIIKCLVENIVVDISFNQLGGLCTLCFLEEVDNLIKQNHLFKRSIILVKAWCYYESRILGAHHGLISTYALETLVLYIFHVFNKSFAGPLEVLYRFLEFFSKFDWDNFCVSLRGPVPISSLPDVTAEPPRRDGGELLLDERFLNCCNFAYAVFPSGQENQGQPFISKHFNVIDPLRVNNNLGRSVSRGNFFRIRSAFTYGAKRLARLLHCPKENVFREINDFFTNTWDRHGHGHRPDAPENELWYLRLPPPNTGQVYGSGNASYSPSSKNDNNFSSNEAKIDFSLQNVSPHHINSSLESTYRISDSSMSRQSHKNYGNLSNNRSTNQSRREVNSKQVGNADKDNRSSRPDNTMNDVKGRYLIGRTHSSPELTDSSNDVSSRVRQNRVPESFKNQNSSARTDNSRRKTMEHDPPSQEIQSSADVLPFGRPIASQQTIDADDSNSASNSYHEDDVRLGVLGEDFASISGAQGMHQAEQDIVNAIASSQVHGFNGQVHMPLSLPHGHLPLNIFPMGMGYAPTHWSANMPFPHGLVSPPYIPNIGFASNSEDSVEPGDQNFGSTDANSIEVEHEFWQDQEGAPTGGFNIENGNFENIRSDDQPQSTLMPYNISTSSRVVSSGGYSRADHQKFVKENQVSSREDHVDAGTRVNESYLDERPTSSRSLQATQSGSLKSKTSSESSWDGSSTKTSKPLREKKGRKAGSSAVTSTMHGKNKSSSDQSSTQADDDGRDWNTLSTGGPEAAERSSGPQPVSSLHVPMHSMPGFESAQTSGSDSVLPFPQVLLGPSSRQRPMDSSRVIAFYPTGPPVPIVAFSVPIRNESGSSEASVSHFGGEEGSATSDSGLNFETSDRSKPSEAVTNSMGQVASIEPIEQKSDVLNSDFTSHWHNLQYGRSCQNSRYPPVIYPSPGVLPPVYVQGHIPWDGTGRLVSANVNLLSQLYGSRMVPIPQLQQVSNGPASVYHVDEMPRYRAGTGTYLPNPKVSPRERHSSTRRGNYSYDRSDHHGDRDGNWHVSSKSRASGRGHNRNQADKLASRSDRVTTGDTQAERTWSSIRHGSLSSYNSQTSTMRSNTTPAGPANVAYSMYHLPAVSPSISPNGPLPSVVMFYPYDHNGAYGTPSDQLEFGSLGAVGLSGLNDVSQLNDRNRLNGALEEQKFSVSRNSPEKPSSPHPRR